MRRLMGWASREKGEAGFHSSSAALSRAECGCASGLFRFLCMVSSMAPGGRCFVSRLGLLQVEEEE